MGAKNGSIAIYELKQAKCQVIVHSLLFFVCTEHCLLIVDVVTMYECSLSLLYCYCNLSLPRLGHLTVHESAGSQRPGESCTVRYPGLRSHAQ